jgi:hypothetical protein
MTRPYAVGLVLDPQFGDRIEELASRTHVWVIASQANRRVAERLWAKGLKGMEIGGVTTFGKDRLASDREHVFLDEIANIDEHHYYHSPPYSVLEVVGVFASETLRRKLQELGFKTFTETPEGFRATKDVSDRPTAV